MRGRSRRMMVSLVELLTPWTSSPCQASRVRGYSRSNASESTREVGGDHSNRILKIASHPPRWTFVADSPFRRVQLRPSPLGRGALRDGSTVAPDSPSPRKRRCLRHRSRDAGCRRRRAGSSRTERRRRVRHPTARRVPGARRSTRFPARELWRGRRDRAAPIQGDRSTPRRSPVPRGNR